MAPSRAIKATAAVSSNVLLSRRALVTVTRKSVGVMDIRPRVTEPTKRARPILALLTTMMKISVSDASSPMTSDKPTPNHNRHFYCLISLLIMVLPKVSLA